MVSLFGRPLADLELEDYERTRVDDKLCHRLRDALSTREASSITSNQKDEQHRQSDLAAKASSSEHFVGATIVARHLKSHIQWKAYSKQELAWALFDDFKRCRCPCILADASGSIAWFSTPVVHEMLSSWCKRKFESSHAGVDFRLAASWTTEEAPAEYVVRDGADMVPRTFRYERSDAGGWVAVKPHVEEGSGSVRSGRSRSPRRGERSDKRRHGVSCGTLARGLLPEEAPVAVAAPTTAAVAACRAAPVAAVPAAASVGCSTAAACSANMCACPECGAPPAQADSKFCHRCGACLAASDHDDAWESLGPEFANLLGAVARADRSDRSNLQIEGFRFEDGPFHPAASCCEEDWDALRSKCLRKAPSVVQEESDSSGDEPRFANDRVVDVDVSSVFNLQTECSAAFSDGTPLDVLRRELRDGKRHPMRDDFLILGVVAARIRSPHLRQPGCSRTPRRVVYYTLDHRRLLCMRASGCKRVRVRIKLSGRFVDDLFNKATDSLGQRTYIRVTPRGIRR